MQGNERQCKATHCNEWQRIRLARWPFFRRPCRGWCLYFQEHRGRPLLDPSLSTPDSFLAFHPTHPLLLRTTVAVKRIVPQRPRPAPPRESPGARAREAAPGLGAEKHSGFRCHWGRVRADPRRIGISLARIRPVFEGSIRPGVFSRAAGGGTIPEARLLRREPDR